MKAEAFGLYKNKGELSPLLPDFVAESILEVDFEHLKKLGIKHILIDLDQTIRRIGTRKIEDKVLGALLRLNDTGLFASVSLVTNNYWPKRFANALGIAAFTPFWDRLRPIRKPNVKFFEHVLSTLQARPSEAVMIGDKIHSDILGANNSGMLTVLVKPRGRDYWFDRLLLTRYRERRSLKEAWQSLKTRRKRK